MRKAFPALLLVGVVLVAASCASHKPMGAQFRSAQDMTTQQTVDGVVWGVDGLSASEFDRVYDWKFSRRGYSAAILAVRNNSDTPVRLAWQDVDGAVDPEEIIQKGQRQIFTRLLAWNAVPIIDLVGWGTLAVGDLVLIGISVGDAIMAGNCNGQMTDDIRRQSLRDIVVQPDRPYEGLVYFRGTPRQLRVNYRHGEQSKQVELVWR